MHALVQEALDGNRLALARILTQIENDSPDAAEMMDALFPRTGEGHIIGVTGSPGTGKSSLVNQLALAFRKQGNKVAIIAIDPSSPFSGGAILGDRIRMKDLTGDTDVFIRSLASRGSLGGLSVATANITRVFDALGYHKILIETVGAGQSEVEIAELAHTTMVVEAPGMGDDIQAIKAGILEIADILVINKADRDGAEQTEAALRAMLDLDHPHPRMQHHGRLLQVQSPVENANHQVWHTPIIKTIATTANNIEGLASLANLHMEHLKSSGEWHQRSREMTLHELESTLKLELLQKFVASIPTDALTAAIKGVDEKKWSPRSAVRQLMNIKK